MAFTVTPTGTARSRGNGSPTITVFQESDFQRMLDDDLDGVFIPEDSEDFAIEVPYTHAAGETETYQVIFDDPGVSPSVRLDADFRTIQPQIRIAEHRLKRPVKKDDRVRVKGNLYFVEDYESDGVGVTTIFLRIK